jgi:hypothetical protein
MIRFTTSLSLRAQRDNPVAIQGKLKGIKPILRLCIGDGTAAVVPPSQ